MGVLHPLLPGTPQVTPPKILSAGTPKRTATCKRRLYRRLAERRVVSSANKETLEKSLSSDIKQKHPTDVECFCFGNRRRRVVICSSLRPRRGCGVGLPCAQSLLSAAGKCKPFRRSAFLTKLSAPSLIFPRGCAFSHIFCKRKNSHKRASFFFWKPASTYSPGPCPAKYHLRG